MKDFPSDEFAGVQFIRENFLEATKVFGFKLMEPSAIEFLETLGIKTGKEIEDEVYCWDDKHDRKIGLRFDFTIGITRYVTGQQSIKLPAKISSFGTVWRHKETDRKRFRYFNQWNIETFGKLNSEHDAEVIEFTSKFFKKIKLNNVEIDISHRKLAESYIQKIFESKDPQIITDILRAVDKIERKSKQEIISEFKKKGHSSEKLEKIIQFSEINGTPEEIQDKFDTTVLDGWNEIKAIFESLHNRNVKNIRINFGIVRGLDYYTGIVFEVFDTENRELGALAGGGRYDDLPKLFGRDDLGATGVAGGVDRIRLALKNKNPNFVIPTPRISVVYTNSEMRNKAIRLTSELREILQDKCIDIDLNDKPMKKQMDQSDEFTIIVGLKELEDGMYALKNMAQGSQQNLSKDNLFSELKKINP